MPDSEIMTSVTNGSGLNFQNGINPLGRKVRALEADVDMLKKELNLLKNSGAAKTAATASVTEVPPTLLADLESLKRELAAMKAAGFGKGEKGDKGDKGDRGEKGEKGDPGPMTYIAMPPQMMAPTAAVPTTTAIVAPVTA